MRNVGVIGLGDMGSGLAKNLIKAGFSVRGCDLDEQRLTDFEAMGGEPCPSPAALGAVSDAVFVMVMNGTQAKEVILGDGLVSTMSHGSGVILTATIHPSEARAIGAALEGTGLHLIDSPVSGGYPGAQSGTLALMAAGTDEALEEFRPMMEAVGKAIHRVGEEPGTGQTVKACLQTLIGSIFTATFEASVLAAKAGVKGQVIYDVFSSSGAGSGVTNTALENIIDRQFAETGSHISTMHKDLTIALDLARELGVPLFTASTAMQLFQAGKTKHPDSDNWVVATLIEEIVGARLAR
ncbi:MAG: NAD(P)-dependent oxidoreductase [Hyphomicrobiales bacterium]|nr:NAD(P)-dependent oxidoreductase [Hyphomicrobiales bacterium]